MNSAQGPIAAPEPTADTPEARLGRALYSGADEVAEGVLARLEVVGLDRRKPGPHVYEAIAETNRLAAHLLGRWLTTGEEITTDEGETLSALGDLVGEVCLPGLVKSYLAFRDVTSDLIARESDRLGIPSEVGARARSMMERCTDGCLVTMCRRFDDERTRLASELLAEQTKLQHLALHDSLTGLANRAMFKQSLDDAVHQARTTESGVLVLYADLDDFKSVNDALGHDAGDRLLIEVANRLKRVVRSSDTVARLGGDEFVILRGGASDAEQETRQLVERVQVALSQPFALDGRTVWPAASVGVAYTCGGQGPDALLAKADRAMYEAKPRARHLPEREAGTPGF